MAIAKVKRRTEEGDADRYPQLAEYVVEGGGYALVGPWEGVDNVLGARKPAHTRTSKEQGCTN